MGPRYGAHTPDARNTPAAPWRPSMTPWVLHSPADDGALDSRGNALHAWGRRPDRPMITYGPRVITWGEMPARASRVALALRAAGVGPAARVVHDGHAGCRRRRL
jgi:non-ribosomal peptide synthetase component F